MGACTSAPKFSKEESIPLNAANWEVVYDGDGRVQFLNSGIFLQPRPPMHQQETVAALLVSRFVPRKNDFRIRVRYRVDRQLRPSEGASGSASRPWEVFWLFWGYQEGRTPALKQTNYFIFKPNGVELGRAFEETDQIFLATADSPQLALGRSYELVLTRTGEHVAIEIDGQPALQFGKRTWPQALYEENGKIGLYVEDAGAVVQGVWISYR